MLNFSKTCLKKLQKKNGVNAMVDGMSLLLHYCLAEDAMEIHGLFANPDLDPNLGDELGWTPLQIMVRNNQFTIVNLLLDYQENGVSVTVTTPNDCIMESGVCIPKKSTLWDMAALFSDRMIWNLLPSEATTKPIGASSMPSSSGFSDATLPPAKYSRVK